MRLTILILATWRLSRLIQAENGPFDLILYFRNLMGSSVFGKLMDCFFCVSFWVGLLMAAFYFYFYDRSLNWFILGMALSGGASLIYVLTEEQH